MQLQKLRLQKGWSQQQLAELSGLSARTIQRIEGGQTASVETLKSLASVFEIEFQQLQSEADMGNHNLEQEQTEQLALMKVRKIKRFYLHLLQFIVVISALAIFNLVKSPQNLWFIWPALGWGIGLLLHAARIFEWIPFFGGDWEKRQVEKRMGRPL